MYCNNRKLLTVFMSLELNLNDLNFADGSNPSPDIHKGWAKGLSSGVQILELFDVICSFKICWGVAIKRVPSCVAGVVARTTLSMFDMFEPWHIIKFSKPVNWNTLLGFTFSPILHKFSKHDHKNGFSFRALLKASTARGFLSVLDAILAINIKANEAWSPYSVTISSKLLFAKFALLSNNPASASAYLWQIYVN